MPAGNVHLTVEQGTTWQKTLRQLIDGEAVDLTDYSARMQVRTLTGGALVLDLADGDGITLGGATGEITIDLAEEVTAALAPGDYRYDLELVDADENVERFAEGFFTVTAEVTVPVPTP
jgi:hypothetical protein